MATQIPGDQPTSMVERIKRLLTAPAQEWPRIDAEPMTIKGIYTGWVVPAGGDRPGRRPDRLAGLRLQLSRHHLSPADRRSGGHRGGRLCHGADRRLCPVADHQRAGAELRRHQECGLGLQGRGLYRDRRAGCAASSRSSRRSAGWPSSGCTASTCSGSACRS